MTGEGQLAREDSTIILRKSALDFVPPILSSSNSIAAYCQVENVLAMVRACRRYGRYPIES